MSEHAERIYGLIGDPVEHSLSPFIMQRAFRAHGIDARYVGVPVTRDGLGASLRGLESMGFVGVNVTYPLKNAVLEFVRETSTAAGVIRAANTLTLGDAGIVADNTDAAGTVLALTTFGDTKVEGKRAFVFGAGGAGRAAAYGLLSSGAASVTFGVRDTERSRKGAERLVESFPKDKIDWYDIRGLSSDRPFAEVDIIINATPVGMGGVDDAILVDDEALIDDRHVCFEFVYHPRVTPLVESARQRGARVVDGIALLVAQASLSFERWTGERFSLEDMNDAVHGHIEPNGER